MDQEAVRTFLAVADEGQIQIAAAELGITQQAASKRVAALERELGVRLFTRTPRGARLTLDGETFLPHARELLTAAGRAVDSVRGGRRPLRVDVLAANVITNGVVQDFHRAHPHLPLDVVALGRSGKDALAAVREGRLDAAFWTRIVPEERLPQEVRSARVIDEPAILVTGTAHPLADRTEVTPAELAGHRIWMPGMLKGSEWAAYYEELERAFGLTIDVGGTTFGGGHLLRTVAAADDVATIMGTRTPLTRPTDIELRFVPVRRPTPLYPLSLLWRADSRHPGLAALLAYLTDRYEAPEGGDFWTPRWA
ncbi:MULTISPECIES: LysR family transcriptional regulator [unclassified Streptomyces]|uniref:LysR family transcriptional regulator n=1 Tax=unclassified Streptomyces TaxID=2593676 RepID=UPI00278C5DC3|nr:MULTISPECIES: LysR family transcriptional regulator [unclassified Streptomyces]